MTPRVRSVSHGLALAGLVAALVAPLPAHAAPEAAILIGDTTVLESESIASFSVSMLRNGGRPITVAWETRDGSALGDADFVAASGSLEFRANETTHTIEVPVLDDALDEDDETFDVVLTGASDGGMLVDDTGRATVQDDDAPPAVSIAGAAAAEGSVASASVALSAASGKTVTVRYATADGSAIAPGDYEQTSGTITFSPGQTTAAADISTRQDTLDEDDETLAVSLSDPSNATIGDGAATVTILDDDPLPLLTIGDDSERELEWLATPLEFSVRLSAPSGRTVTVAYATVDDTAVSPADYTAKSGTLTFAPGETLQTVRVSFKQDPIYELSERFFVRLSNPVNAGIADGEGIGTISNDDPAPELRISDPSVVEGHTGSTSMNFTVTLTGQTAVEATVQYKTFPTVGTATDGVDYQGVAGSLAFAPGETSKSIVVTVFGDALDESDETLHASIFTATHATIADGSGIGTILDDDPTPTVSVNDVTVVEGDAGTIDAVFTVSLSEASGRTSTVVYTTVDGTAGSGDYVKNAGSLSFTAGQTSKQIVVKVSGDTVAEEDETFTLKITTAINLVVADGEGLGTILTDDAGIVVEDATALEGDDPLDSSDDLRFVLRLTAPSEQTVTFQYSTLDESARMGIDYLPQGGMAVFLPGQPLTQTVTVPVLGNERPDPTRTMILRARFADGAPFIKDDGRGTIFDDDATPLTVHAGDATEFEGQGSIQFLLTLSRPSAQAVVVPVATRDGTARAGADYLPVASSVVFAPGEVVRIVSVPVIDDREAEGFGESLFLDVPGAVGATPARPSAMGWIFDDDNWNQPHFQTAGYSTSEGGDLVFTITLPLPSRTPVVVSFATSGGELKPATGSRSIAAVFGAPADYEDQAGAFTWLPGETGTRTVIVPTLHDTACEKPFESVQVVFDIEVAGDASWSDAWRDPKPQANILDDDC